MEISNKFNIVTIPNIIAGFVSGFLAVLVIRIIYPILDTIFNMMDSGINKVTAQLIMWLMFVFVLYFGVFSQMFSANNEEQGM